MIVTVREIFQDKFTKQHYSEGEKIDVSETRYKELLALGLVEEVKAPRKRTAKK